MLFGSPLRAAISRSGRASPEVRNAERSCDEWTTDFTRYGSRPSDFGGTSRLVRERCQTSRLAFRLSQRA